MSNKTENTPIVLNQTAIDYITVTAYDDLAYDVFKSMVDFLMKDPGTRLAENSKRQQYTGETVHHPAGTFFHGTGQIGGRYHHMAQVSGYLAWEVWPYLVSGINTGWLRCRRLDLQITIPYPETWDQWRFFNRMKAVKRSVGWIESAGSNGKPLETVYVGSRKSEKFLRLYVKESAGGSNLLRYEIEFKGSKAESLAQAVSRGDLVASSVLLHHVQSMNDDQLSLMIEPRLQGIIPAKEPKVVKPESKTEIWLKETVYQAFVRVISEHGSNGEVLILYANAIDKVLNR